MRKIDSLSSICSRNKNDLINVLRLLYSAPRVYKPLLNAWATKHPETSNIIKAMVEMGLVDRQDRIVADTLQRKTTYKSTRSVTRYVLTSKGKRLLKNTKEDTRTLSKNFKKITKAQENKLIKLLEVLSESNTKSINGLSIPYMISKTDMAPRSLRWWVVKLKNDGYITTKPHKQADIREVIPMHYRPTKNLSKKVKDLINDGILPVTLIHELKLNRTRYLSDINPSRLGLSGATDYDHDIQTQKILAKMLLSPKSAANGIFVIEPRLTLNVNKNKIPHAFNNESRDSIFYQPDAETREVHNGNPVRVAVEYERFQSRKDAWSHVERFLGWLHLKAQPQEQAILRFVVENDKRLTAYVNLIEAFVDSCLDNPQRVPLNDITLSVTTVDRVLTSTDPLSDLNWHRIKLPQSAETLREPVIHDEKSSPYHDYFARG